MTEQEMLFVVGSLFGVYVVGWLFGHFITFIKQLSEKI